MRAFLALVILVSSLSFLFATPSEINYSGNSSACPAWTAYQPSLSRDYVLRDEMGYARKCHNVTYISYCLSTDPTIINFNLSRTYWDIDCTNADYCQGWTRFYIEKSRNFTERDPTTNLSRACTSSTYVAWCIKAPSTVNYAVGHRYSELNCSDWQQTCGFNQAGVVKKRLEKDPSGYCRSCSDTTYRYFCNTSGKISWGPSQVQSICGNWTVCPGYNASSSTTGSTTGSSNNSLGVIDPSVVTVTVLAGVVLTFILILVFGRSKEQ